MVPWTRANAADVLCATHRGVPHIADGLVRAGLHGSQEPGIGNSYPVDISVTKFSSFISAALFDGAITSLQITSHRRR